MSKFLTWRRMAWALELWGAYVLAWALITHAGPASFTLWSLTGAMGLGSLWLVTQPGAPARARLHRVLRPIRVDEPARPE